jgi:DegV family protein with EDD domain
MVSPHYVPRPTEVVVMPVRVVTDSTSYIPPAMSAGLPLSIVSLTVTLGGVTQRESDMGLAETEAYYRLMQETGEFPTSSQPSIADTIDAFEAAVAAGDDVVAVFISSDMSGTFSTAEIARAQVLERFPDARIELVDSRSNSMEVGFPALAAARVAADGGTLEEAAAAARHMIGRTRWLFVPNTLDYLKMGGRIGTASALLGSLLEIRPILTVEAGHTAPVRKVRTRARAMAEIVALFAADVAARGLGDVVVHHIHDEAAAADMAEQVEAVIGRSPVIVALGPVIGAHVGPGALGLVYWTQEAQPKTAEANN